MLAAHLYILASWLLLTFVFFGWGALVCSLARCQRDDAQALLVNPWIGLACVTGLLQIWNLAAPVNAWALVLVGLIGILAGAAFSLGPLRQIWDAARHHPRLFCFGTFVCLWLVNRSLSTQEYPDQGLYYLNAIRWAADYAIVPGLANLHSRLAFNNSNFLLHAMLEPAVGRGFSAHILNGLLAAWTVPVWIGGLSSIFKDEANERQLGWFPLAVAMTVAAAAMDRRISSATPDFPAALCILLASWRLLAMAASDAESTGRLLRWNLLAITTLAMMAVSFKTNVIFFAGLAAVALTLCLYRLAKMRDVPPVPFTIRSLGFMRPWCALLFIPWVARGYVLSGYPLFPSTIGGAPLDWALDEASADELRQTIYAWARTYHGNVEQGYEPGWGWVPDWAVHVVLLRATVEVFVPFAISLIAAGWLAWRRPMAWQPDEVPANGFDSMAHFAGWMLAIGFAAAIVLWFVTAPSPRMGSFAWWGLAATLLGLVSRTATAGLLLRCRPIVVAGLITLLLLPMVDEAVRVHVRYRKNPNLPEFGRQFYEFHPFVLSAGWPEVPKAELDTQETDSGLVVYVAPPREDAAAGHLWDSPLPATPTFDRRLVLRRAGELQSGFRIAGSRRANARSPDSP
jgi:hypothetical protein